MEAKRTQCVLRKNEHIHVGERRAKRVTHYLLTNNDKRKQDTHTHTMQPHKLYGISYPWQLSCLENELFSIACVVWRAVDIGGKKWSAILFMGAWGRTTEEELEGKKTEKRIFFVVCIYSSTHITRSWIERVCVCVSCICYMSIFRFAIYLVCCTFVWQLRSMQNILPIHSSSRSFCCLPVLLSSSLLHIVLNCKDTLNFYVPHELIHSRRNRKIMR